MAGLARDMSGIVRTRRIVAAACIAICVASACGGDAVPNSQQGGGEGADIDAPLTVLAAGSLARPLRAALDTFAAATGTRYTLESAGSLEVARRLRDLGKPADIVALADEDVFPRLLMPAHVSWYARFARNRLVLAHAAGAPGARDADRGEWRHVLLRDGVAVGRSDPDLDPAGYRTLMLYHLAEQLYHEPGLASRLAAGSPPRLVRSKSAELVALLQAGELDYAWMYESSARGARLPFVALPPEIDLGDESRAAAYQTATVRVLGTERGDTIEMQGTPIRYGVSIPRDAPQPERAARFMRFLFSNVGQRVLRSEYLDALAAPIVVGTGAPPFLDSLGATAARPAPVAPADAQR